MPAEVKEEASRKEERKARKPKRRGLFIPLVLVVGIVAAAVDVFPIRQLIAQNRDLKEVELRLLEIQEENLRLEREIELLHTPAEIERIARSDFGYVRPGEVSYAIIEDDLPATEQPVDAEPAPPAESGGFFDALWDYMTGRDRSD